MIGKGILRRIAILFIVCMAVIALSNTAGANSAINVGLLVQNVSYLDADENNIQQFLVNNSYQYDIIDSSMIKNSTVNLDSYKVLYMRTGSEPVGYNDIDVISKINASVKKGGKLILEYYGLYLGSYLGVSTININTWDPVVHDVLYFVETNSSSSLFSNLNSWSPPTLPDNNSQLMVQLTTPGVYSYPAFNFNTASQTLPYWNLYVTYGWSGQAINSDYCLQHSGLCMSDRSVYFSNNAVPFSVFTNGIEYINYDSGEIYKLGLNIGQMVSASKLIFGSAAQQMRKNIVDGNLTSTPTPTSQVILPYRSIGYKYKIVAFGGNAGFEQPNFDDSGFSVGDAGFGTQSGFCSVNNPTDAKTIWPLNTDILLRKEFNLPSGTTNLTVGVTIDNDVQVFINGYDISGGLQSHGGCPPEDTFVFNAPDSILKTGSNLVAIRA